MVDKQSVTVEYLRSFKPGVLPKEIFLEITRLTVTPIIELVPFRKLQGSIELLLLKRPQDDPIWPNQLHTPGTVLLSTDQSIEAALGRVIQKELPKTNIANDPIYVGHHFHKVARGTEFALIFWNEVKSSKDGDFFIYEDTFSLVIDTQKEFIEKAYTHFQKFK